MSAPVEAADTYRKPAFLRSIRNEAGAEIFLIPVLAFPVLEPQRTALRAALRLLVRALASHWRAASEVFIQYNQLHRGDGPRRFADHAREWAPQMGLGVWPDRKPPRYYTKEDFEELGPGDSLKPVLYKVFRVRAPQEVRERALEEMLGLGTLVVMITSEDSELLVRRTSALFGASIPQGSIRSFPFYIPLLELNTLTSASVEQMETWLSGAPVYIRESVEDDGVVVAAARPLEPILEQLGASYQPGPDSGWHIGP